MSTTKQTSKPPRRIAGHKTSSKTVLAKNTPSESRQTYKYFDIIMASFVGFLLISNIAAVKLISFSFGSIGHIVTDGGAILFPLTYIFSDVLTEVYGFSYARRAIWMGFVMQFMAVMVFLLVGIAPSALEWAANQSSYQAILGFVPRIVGASLVAYLFGEFMNSIVLAKLKLKTGGKKLGLRLIGSTIIGEAFDTVIFCLIAFGGILHGSEMLNYILVGWIFKVGVEIVLLPVTYRVINFLKTSEQVDSYDTKTSFSPLSLHIKSTENRFTS